MTKVAPVAAPSDAAARAHRLLVSGALLLVAAIYVGAGAWRHMQAQAAAYGPVCGGSALLPHCLACYLAAGLVLLAATCVGLGLEPRLASARSAEARPSPDGGGV